MKQILVRSTEHCSLAFLLDDDSILSLKKLVFSNSKKTVAKLNQIYLAILEEKVDSLGIFIVRISESEKIIVKAKKDNFNKLGNEKFHLGQKVLVQITREKNTLDKMAVGTFDIILSIGALRYQPSLKFNIVSKNNEISKAEIALDLKDKKGFIIRTFYRYYGKSALHKEIDLLEKTWDRITKSEEIGLVYEANFIEELLSNNLEYISKDIMFENQKDYNQFQETVNKYPSLKAKAELYSSAKGILENYDVEDYETHIFANKIAVSNKISIDITKTHSFNYIDINFKGDDGLSSNKDEGAFHSNSKALDYVEHYINLQGLSGQIFIDVLKVNNKQYRKILLEKLQKLFDKDNNSAKVLGFSNLGLIEVLAKKVRDSHSLQLKSDIYYQAMKVILYIQEQQRINPLITVKILASLDVVKKIKNYFKKDLDTLSSRVKGGILYIDNNKNNITAEIIN